AQVAEGVIASSQGSAMAAPTPRKTVRRESRDLRFMARRPQVGSRQSAAPFQEWVTFDNAQHEDPEAVSTRFEALDNLLDRAAVIFFQSPAEGVREHLFSQAAGEVASMRFEDLS